MKILVVIAVLIIVGIAWSISDCNNKLPFDALKQYQSNYCFCKSPTVKAQGLNESKCVMPHKDSMNSCAAYDHCTAPEECVRQPNQSFACQYVQAGCYEAYGIDQVVKQKCV